MTGLDIKHIDPLIKEFSPTEELKTKFYQTFFGSLMGQTFFFMGLLAIYFAIIALLYSYAKTPLQAFLDDFGPVFFWSVLTVPLVCILLFQTLPAALRALRERRLKTMAIEGIPKPGYFRLQPYNAADRDVFERLDGADREILNWLTSTKSSLLYLSGASGVGKSSLLSAGVLPKLREADWSVIETRTFENPMARMRAALLGTKSVFKRMPVDGLSLRELLRKAADLHATSHATPLLIIVDQFEEFLILRDEAGRDAFAEFLNELAKYPIHGLRLLLVFRSDYRPLVFKLGLPSLSGENWYEISPYNRSEATSLLQGGGRELSVQRLDALFRGLDRIEDAPGLYRPITINMIGLVLESMGGMLRGDPARLIQAYLINSLTTSKSSDFAKPLLAEMITDARTKEPHSEAELAVKTGFEPWQVKATLADLARGGLVRRLEGVEAMWEISHDFLAGTIGQLIGRLKPPLMERVRPLVAPVALFGWVILFAAALPFWQLSQQRAIEKALRESFPMSLTRTERGDASYYLAELNDRTLAEAVGVLERDSELVNLSIGDAPGVTTLEPLKKLINLSTLRIDGRNEITTLEPLKAMTKLYWLSINAGTGVDSLEPLKELNNLSALDLTSFYTITSLTPLQGLTNLSWLNLYGATGIISLEPLKGLTHLSMLDLTWAWHITNLEPLRGLTNLTTLHLFHCAGITNLEPLSELTNLSLLDLNEVIGITSLAPLKRLTNLTRLYIAHSNGITSLEPLKELTNLTTLDLRNRTTPTDLEPLKRLTNLQTLDLSGATGITDLEPLRELTNLTTVYLEGNTGITSLEPLRGLANLSSLRLRDATGITSLEPVSKLPRLVIVGASDELLATLR